MIRQRIEMWSKPWPNPRRKSFGQSRAVLLWGIVATWLFGAAIVAGLLVASQVQGGVQLCNTQCQSRMTDCILACDQSVPCVQRCSTQVLACTRSCASPIEAVVLDAGSFEGGRGGDAGLHEDATSSEGGLAAEAGPPMADASHSPAPRVP